MLLRLQFQSTLPARGATSAFSSSPNISLDFNPRSPHGERQRQRRRRKPRKAFQSTLPARGATSRLLFLRRFFSDFNPRSPHGERQRQRRRRKPRKAFQSTLPARGATSRLLFLRRFFSDFNPRSPHGERRRPYSFQHAANYFNPRSPHGERRYENKTNVQAIGISIHAPRTGSDQYAWRNDGELQDFNPRSPHGERQANTIHRQLVLGISIHAPRTGSDRPWWEEATVSKMISIHAPRTGSDCARKEGSHDLQISIHAPRTGSDPQRALRSRKEHHFNPRSPHGERLDVTALYRTWYLFQSTLPARGATYVDLYNGNLVYISIHAPRTGSDPQGARHRLPRDISIHAPRTGSDYGRTQSEALAAHFNPRSPHGERQPRRKRIRSGVHKFQSTLPARGATRGGRKQLFPK